MGGVRLSDEAMVPQAVAMGLLSLENFSAHCYCWMIAHCFIGFAPHLAGTSILRWCRSTCMDD